MTKEKSTIGHNPLDMGLDELSSFLSSPQKSTKSASVPSSQATDKKFDLAFEQLKKDLDSGDISARLDSDSFSGAWNGAAEKINDLLDFLREKEVEKETIDTRNVDTVRMIELVKNDLEMVLDEVYEITVKNESLEEGVNTSIEELDKILELADEGKDVVESLENTGVMIEGAAEEFIKLPRMLTYLTGQLSVLALNSVIEASREETKRETFSLISAEMKTITKEMLNLSEDFHTQATQMENDIRHVVSNISNITRVMKQIRDVQKKINSTLKDQLSETSTISDELNMLRGMSLEMMGNLDTYEKEIEETEE